MRTLKIKLAADESQLVFISGSYLRINEAIGTLKLAIDSLGVDAELLSGQSVSMDNQSFDSIRLINGPIAQDVVVIVGQGEFKDSRLQGVVTVEGIVSVQPIASISYFSTVSLDAAGTITNILGTRAGRRSYSLMVNTTNSTSAIISTSPTFATQAAMVNNGVWAKFGGENPLYARSSAGVIVLLSVQEEY